MCRIARLPIVQLECVSCIRAVCDGPMPLGRLGSHVGCTPTMVTLGTKHQNIHKKNILVAEQQTVHCSARACFVYKVSMWRPYAIGKVRVACGIHSDNDHFKYEASEYPQKEHFSGRTVELHDCPLFMQSVFRVWRQYVTALCHWEG